MPQNREIHNAYKIDAANSVVNEESFRRIVLRAALKLKMPIIDKKNAKQLQLFQISAGEPRNNKGRIHEYPPISLITNK
jgi:hypothetical protein